MSPDELAQVWAPIPLHWKHVVSGDVIVDRGGELWIVGDNELPRGGVQVRARQGGDTYFARDVDADDVVRVLVPVTERDALRLTRDQLGAQILDRRTREAA